MKGEYGKPCLEVQGTGTGIEFNLSHSGHIALMAVALESAVGIDAQQWTSPEDPLALADRFFSPVERETLRSFAREPELLAQCFFDCWARKEAYVKATGYGLARGLAHFDVAISPGAPVRLLSDRLDTEATEKWQIAKIEVPRGYSAALAVEAPLLEVVIASEMTDRSIA